MKKLLAALTFLFATTISFAQNEEQPEERKGFDIEKMFAGGSVNLGLGGGSFNVGANPQIGYSVANWLDVGLTTNIIYYSQKYNINFNEYRDRSWNYGGGPFVRICPIRMVHLQAQYEYNWISGTAEHINSGTKQKFNVSAPSLLVGAGCGQRFVGQSWFFTTVLFDITKNDNSPYVYTEGQSKISLPIVRAGFNVYFSRKKDQ
jgi:hypothetical protein